MRKMKESGIEWIGEIPEDWSLPSIKSVFEIGRGRVIAKTELEELGIYPVYSSQTKDNGILGYINTYDFERSQLTWTTDGANAGTVFLRKGKHNCTNVCGTLLPKDKDSHLEYLKYAIDYVAFYNKRADTNGYKIMNNEMAQIIFPFPNFQEQQKIVNYLDEKVSAIDNIIEKTKESIKEYKKYKQSLITETVTKGLDLNVKMKDSGIEWIGEIPVHWIKIKFNRIVDFVVDNRGKTPPLSEVGIPMLEIDALGLKYPKVDNIKKFITQDTFDNFLRNYLAPGDIMFATVGATIGKTSIVPEDFNFCIAQNIVGYRIKKKHSYIYWYYYMNSDVFKTTFLQFNKGNIQDSIKISDLKEGYIVSPPYSEQIETVKLLDSKINDIDEVILKKELLLQELESYKKSLIYEVVTGKKEII